VFIQRCDLRCLVILRVSIVSVSYCLQFVVVAVTVDWDGLTGCCDVYWFFHGWRHLRKGCWSLYVEYDLLHSGVHLLWLWEFWFVISAWWLCWTCWRYPTVLETTREERQKHFFFGARNGFREREEENSFELIDLSKPNDIQYIYMSYRSANLQTLHFKYLFNKYTYWIF